MIFDAIRHGLGNLTNFSGRDERPTFWWYVLFLIVLHFVLGFLASIPLLVTTAGTAMDAAQAGVEADVMETQMLDSMAGGIEATGYISAGITALIIALIAAAFVRRIRDAGFSGWWAIVPLALQIAAIVGSLMLLEDLGAILAATRDPAELQRLQEELLLHWSSIAGWLSYIIVFVLGVWPSQPRTD